MTVAELSEGLRVYRFFLQGEVRMCMIMLKRPGDEDANPFWRASKDVYTGCLDKLERQFPFLREI